MAIEKESFNLYLNKEKECFHLFEINKKTT